MLKVTSNDKKAVKSIDNSKIAIRKSFRTGLRNSGQILAEYTKLQMRSGRKSGRLYKVYKGKGGVKLGSPRIHRASAINEYPAPITYKLHDSVGFQVQGYNRMEFGAGTRSMEYASILEKSRNYLKQTVKKLENRVKDTLTKHTNRSLRDIRIKVKKV